MRQVVSAIVFAFLSGTVALPGYAQTPSRDLRARQIGTGVIRGRVLSAATDAPLRNSRVALTSGTGTIPAVFTDRDGRFSFTGLAEGQYALTFKKSGYANPRFDPNSPGEPPERVAVAEGVAIDVGDIRLLPGAAISGRIIDPAGDPVVGVTVSAEMPSGSIRGSGPVTIATTQTDDLGEYRLGGLPGGNILVAADAGPAILGPNGSVRGQITMTTVVNGRMRTMNFDSASMHTYYPGVSRLVEARPIALMVSDEATSIDFVIPSSPLTTPSDPTAIDVTALPVDPDRSPLVGNPPATANIRPDRGFEMGGISGPRLFRLRQPPPGWTLKAVLLNGADVTDMPLPFGTAAQSLTDLEVVLTDRVSELSGTVIDRRDRPATDYTVIVFATDRDSWTPASRFLTTSRPGAHGIFTVTGLPAGEYFVAAIDRLVDGEWRDPDVLESVVPGAMRVTLAEGQRLSVSPRLIAR